ncbi:MAG: recombination protein RecR [Candidatus Yanofskybacteria bacterium RIFCSPHIGHO2_02_FULL_43_15c]|uniref:Recombination protein RecR n=1 Tax=Candidatus Yanofskybacteria bacterium RIFCSPHIGHO2_02_FULL_43_15c TaxID=1802679 RepID=A0A1F8FH94_9BACT|nr:MAG: recombination protein RecR [Candidatus Yanofskybacteria bacterium RIFCSPHIGHO2_02_FULL_43_15c]
MSSKFKKVVEYISKLQGIGPRQSMRIAMGLLNWPKEELANLAEVIFSLSEGINLCQNCFNFSENSHCSICADPKRDQTEICIVEKITDLEAVEKTGLYRGVYHVLGGVINPLEGSLPQSLKIKELVERISKRFDLGSEKRSSLDGKLDLEVIIATNPQTAGETTALYLEELLKPLNIKTTRLAKGLASGSTLEYADPATLHHAFKNRK